MTDQFSISSPGLSGSPIICGYNTNQHMIIDSSGTECQTVNVNVGAETTTSRSWDIYVTQYTCGQEDLAGEYLVNTENSSRYTAVSRGKTRYSIGLPQVLYRALPRCAVMCRAKLFDKENECNTQKYVYCYPF